MSLAPVYRYTTQQVSIANIKPFEHFSHSSVISAQSNTFTENFPNVFQLPSIDNYYNTIESLRVTVDPNGVYNIPTTNSALVGGVLVTFNPGFYNLSTLSTMLNITVPTTGAGSYKATTNSTLLINTSDLAAITGFPIGTTIPSGTTSLSLFNLMNGFDSFYIQCNLTNKGNPAGQVYVAKVVVTDNLGNPNLNASNPIYLNIPINVTNPNSVTWSFFKGNTLSQNPIPWFCQTDVVIFFHVYSYLRDNYIYIEKTKDFSL